MQAKTVFVLSPILGALLLTGCPRDPQPTAPPEEPREEPPPAAEPAPAPEPEEEVTAPTAMAIHEMCPILVEDTDVEVTETADGMMLSFTTDDGDPHELRQHVRHMAAMYEMHGGRTPLTWRQMAAPDQDRMDDMNDEGMPREEMDPEMEPGMEDPGMEDPRMDMDMEMPEVRASVEEIDRGARILLEPRDPDQIQTLRDEVRLHQQRLQAGACWTVEERQVSQLE